MQKGEERVTQSKHDGATESSSRQIRSRAQLSFSPMPRPTVSAFIPRMRRNSDIKFHNGGEQRVKDKKGSISNFDTLASTEDIVNGKGEETLNMQTRLDGNRDARVATMRINDHSNGNEANFTLMYAYDENEYSQSSEQNIDSLALPLQSRKDDRFLHTGASTLEEIGDRCTNERLFHKPSSYVMEARTKSTASELSSRHDEKQTQQVNQNIALSSRASNNNIIRSIKNKNIIDTQLSKKKSFLRKTKTVSKSISSNYDKKSKVIATSSKTNNNLVLDRGNNHKKLFSRNSDDDFNIGEANIYFDKDPTGFRDNDFYDMNSSQPSLKNEKVRTGERYTNDFATINIRKNNTYCVTDLERKVSKQSKKFALAMALAKRDIGFTDQNMENKAISSVQGYFSNNSDRKHVDIDDRKALNSSITKRIPSTTERDDSGTNENVNSSSFQKSIKLQSTHHQNSTTHVSTYHNISAEKSLFGNFRDSDTHILEKLRALNFTVQEATENQNELKKAVTAIKSELTSLRRRRKKKTEADKVESHGHTLDSYRRIQSTAENSKTHTCANNSLHNFVTHSNRGVQRSFYKTGKRFRVDDTSVNLLSEAYKLIQVYKGKFVQRANIVNSFPVSQNSINDNDASRKKPDSTSQNTILLQDALLIDDEVDISHNVHHRIATVSLEKMSARFFHKLSGGGGESFSDNTKEGAAHRKRDPRKTDDSTMSKTLSLQKHAVPGPGGHNELVNEQNHSESPDDDQNVKLSHKEVQNLLAHLNKLQFSTSEATALPDNTTYVPSHEWDGIEYNEANQTYPQLTDHGYPKESKPTHQEYSLSEVHTVAAKAMAKVQHKYQHKFEGLASKCEETESRIVDRWFNKINDYAFSNDEGLPRKSDKVGHTNVFRQANEVFSNDLLLERVENVEQGDEMLTLADSESVRLSNLQNPLEKSSAAENLMGGIRRENLLSPSFLSSILHGKAQKVSLHQKLDATFSELTNVRHIEQTPRRRTDPIRIANFASDLLLDDLLYEVADEILESYDDFVEAIIDNELNVKF